MRQLPASVYADLLMLEQFLAREEAVVFEADLIALHGEQPVWDAIDNGLLEHRRMPFRDGRERCICWLAPKGRAVAANT